MSSEVIQQQQERPEEIRYFLTTYGRGRDEYFLCPDMHKSVEEAVACLKRQGNVDPKVQIREVVETLIYDSHTVAYYRPDGQLHYQDRMATYFIRISKEHQAAHLNGGFKDGSNLSIDEIEKLIKAAQAEHKAKWHARRAARAVRKQALLAKQGGV